MSGRFHGKDGSWSAAEVVALRDRTAGISAAARGIKADGQTFEAAALQAIIEEVGDGAAPGGSRTLIAPPGTVLMDRPLVVKDTMALVGDPGGGTFLSPQYGSGFALTVQKPRAGPTFKNSPYGGRAMRNPTTLLGPFLNLSTDPGADLEGLPALTVESIYERVADVEAGVVIHSSGYVGAAGGNCFGLWEVGATARWYWNGAARDAGALPATGQFCERALVFDPPDVRCYVNGVLVLTFAAGVSTVPQVGGVEQIALGVNPIGPSMQNVSHAGADLWHHSVQISGSARYAANYTPHNAKFAADGATRLLCNFDDSFPPFVKGGGVGGAQAFFLPQTTANLDLGNARLDNLTVVGYFGASGFCLYDAINAELSRLNTVATYWGKACLGNTFGLRALLVRGTSLCIDWMQVNQSEGSQVSSLECAASRVPFLTEGAVGGSYSGSLITPNAGAKVAMYGNGSAEMNFFGCQIDDEGQAPGLSGCVALNGQVSRFYGCLMARTSNAGPIFDLYNGSGAHCYGGRLLAPSTTTEIFHLPQPGRFTALDNDWTVGAGCVPSLTPQYGTHNKDGVLTAPQLAVPTLAAGSAGLNTYFRDGGTGELKWRRPDGSYATIAPAS